MTWAVAVAGTVHRDDITTPRGRRVSLGGSAVYFALAAARYAPVHLNGVVGEDTIEELRSLFAGLEVDLHGVVTSELPTCVWHAEHDFERWLTSNEQLDEGCDAQWQPRLPEATADAPVLFLASMHPRLQSSVLAQSRARMIAMDTMMVFSDSDRDAVRSVVERSDLALLNHAELASLANQGEWMRSARTLLGRGRTRWVVVKRGPLGAALVDAEGVVERPACAPVDVVDPTGAGDALAGGLLGLCAREERADAATVARGLDSGLECAAHAISLFGTSALRAFVRGEGSS